MRGKTCDNQARPVLISQRLHLAIVKLAGFSDHAILNGVVEFPGEIHGRAMRQVAAVRQAHAEYRVARLQQRKTGGCIGLRSGMRLYIGIVGTKQLFSALDRQLFSHVDVFTATVVAFARISLGVFVREYRALCRQDPRTGVILGGDQLDVLFLPTLFIGNGSVQFRVKFFDCRCVGKHPAGLRAEKGGIV